MQCEEDVIYEESDNCEANLKEKFISCCDIGQIDIFFRIELFPLSSLSSDNTNCKNDIPLFHQLFDELSVYRDYH